MWLLILSFFLLITIPYIFLFIKRISLFVKLRTVSKKHSYLVRGTHLFWFLGHNHGKRCDFYIETPNEVFAVKLFAIPRKRALLVIKDDRKYFFRKFRALVSDGAALRHPVNGKLKLMPIYDFQLHNNAKRKTKKTRCILLVNPISMGCHQQPQYGGEVIVGTGECVGNMEVCSSSYFFTLLKNENT